MVEQLARVPAVELVEDLSLYPRLQVDDWYVSRLAEALRSGATLPPIVADRASKRIVDGFHRRRAALRAFGPTAEVDVLFRDYPDERSLYLDALRLNAHHGKRLTTAEEVRAVIRGQELGLEPRVIADTLAIRVEKLEGLLEKKTARGTIEPVVVLKPSFDHLAGEQLTREQELANKHSGGHQASFYARMLIQLIESGAVDESNRILMERLKKLYELLDKFWAERQVA
jgi:ParB-like chromosome segregation protein Spo0J